MAKSKNYIPQPQRRPDRNKPNEQVVVETPADEVIQGEDHFIEESQVWWRKHFKQLMMGLGVILLGLIGWAAYQKFMKEPKEITAAEALFPAENLFDKMASTRFSKDSVNILLNGGEYNGSNITGLLKFMNNNGGTKAADRATYMTGAAYLQIKDFDKAIKYLKDFNGNGAEQIKSKAYIMLGHAYAEKNNQAEAMSNYKKAAEVNPKDPVTTADALYMAGSYASATGKDKEAIDAFKKLRDEFPTSVYVQNGTVDKELAKLGVLD